MVAIKDFNTVSEPSAGEYTEKRSRFISGIYPCQSEADASEILQKVKSDNFGANHNVYAYVLANGNARFSDDGEPHGTAGKPVLEVIEGSGLKNVLVVVTRYFGGVLLGTGGLVRAYTAAAKSAVAAAKTVKMCECIIYNAECAYPDRDKLLSIIEKHKGDVENTEYGENIAVTFKILIGEKQPFEMSLCEAFSGKMTAEIKKTGVFPIKI